MKTTEDFNNKWKDYLEEGFYGMAINNLEVIEYLDKEFEKEIKVNPEFNYAQIKLKFGYPRIYANSKNTREWEKQITKLLRN